ncbi:MAG: LamG domain-containing protein, partial [Actinomycetota bacterium]|nr:LamG domain-containing protein [Actinomycetota bacterium]
MPPTYRARHRRRALAALVGMAALLGGMFAAPASAVLAVDTVAHYFSGDATTHDSTSGATATFAGTPAFSSGVTGSDTDSAFAFDGNSSVSADDPNVGNYGYADFAVHLYAKVDASLPNHGQTIFAKRSVCADHTSYLQLYTYYDHSGLLIDGYDSSNVERLVSMTVPGLTLNDNRYHEFTVRRTGPTYSLTVDNQPTASQTLGGVPSLQSTAPFTIGRSVCDVPNSGSTPFAGSIDAVNLGPVNRHLYPAEGSPADSLGRSPAAWVGSPSYAAGIGGGANPLAFNFTGANSLTIPDTSVGSVGTQDLLVHLWAKFPIGTTGSRELLSKRQACSGGVFFDLRTVSTSMQWELRSNAVGNTVIANFPNLFNNAWHEITARRTAGTISLQIDAGPVFRVTTGGVANLTSSVPVRLGMGPCVGGGGDGTLAMSGQLDDVMISALPALTVQGPTVTAPYGSPLPPLNASYAGLIGPLVGSATCITIAHQGSPANTYPSVCNGVTDPAYAVSYASGSLTVAPAALDVGGPTVTVPYGTAVPALTPQFTGLVNGDKAPAVPGTCTSTGHTGSPVGSYPTTCSGTSDPNYTVAGYSPGAITVSAAAPLSVLAPSPTIVYGDALPTLSPSYSGLVNGDIGPATPASCSTTAVAGSPAGSYPVTCTGAADGNYSAVIAVPGTLTIAPHPLTVAGPNAASTYGTAPPSTFTPGYTGLVNGDTAPSTVGTCNSAANPGSPPANYPVLCTGFADPNYTITATSGSLTVSPAGTVTVLAPSPSVIFGGSLPALTPHYAGLVNGDLAPATAPTCSTTAHQGSPAGTYPVTCSGAADPNYAGFLYPAGSLTVTPAPVTVAAPSVAVVYGAQVPATFAPATTGVLQGAPLATAGTCRSTATNGAAAGTYPITCTGFIDPNYTVSTTPGTLTVSTGPSVTVTALSVTLTYGSPLPAGITPSYTGLVNGDSAPSTPATCSTTAHAGSAAGTYPVTCVGAADPNYTAFSYTSGTVTVRPHALLVTGPAARVTYGGVVPLAFAPVYTGLVNGDSAPATLGTCTSSAHTGSPAGAYPLACSGFTDPNYLVSFASGKLTVAPAGPVTVLPPAASAVYGAAPPALLSPTYTGLVNGDTAPATPAVCTSPAHAGSPPGRVPVSCSGAADRNYSAFQYPAGALTVTPAPLTVAAPTVSVPFGDPLPTHLTPAYQGLVSPATTPTTVGTCRSSAVPGVAGSSPITCAGFADANYAITYRAGTLTVLAAPATPAASPSATPTGVPSASARPLTTPTPSPSAALASA